MRKLPNVTETVFCWFFHSEKKNLICTVPPRVRLHIYVHAYVYVSCWPNLTVVFG